MNFFKTSFWSAVSTVIKVIAGFITTKILAIFVGPEGVALLGNYNNIISTLSSFANGAIGSGITKYISEFDNEEDKKSVVSHSIKISFSCSCIIGFIILIFNKQFTKLAFGDLEYKSIFIILGLTIIFYGLNSTITAIYNGYRYIKSLIITNIIGSILTVILAVVFTVRFSFYGALIYTIIAQVFIFMVNILFVYKLKLFNLKLLRIELDKELLWKLFKFGTMSIVSALVVPTSTLLIRKYISNNFSPKEAGYIQGVWSISSSYLLVVTTTLSIYYLPTLSAIKNDKDLRKEIFKGYKFILPMAILGGLAIYIFRNLIIYIMYTPEFLPMKDYFTFQIIGDMFKIASWLLGFLMVAKAMTKIYIISEIVFSLQYMLFSFLFMHYFGSVGVTYAYTLNYVLFLIFLIVFFRKLLFTKKYSNT